MRASKSPTELLNGRVSHAISATIVNSSASASTPVPFMRASGSRPRKQHFCRGWVPPGPAPAHPQRHHLASRRRPRVQANRAGRGCCRQGGEATDGCCLGESREGGSLPEEQQLCCSFFPRWWWWWWCMLLLLLRSSSSPSSRRAPQPTPPHSPQNRRLLEMDALIPDISPPYPPAAPGCTSRTLLLRLTTALSNRIRCFFLGFL